MAAMKNRFKKQKPPVPEPEPEEPEEAEEPPPDLCHCVLKKDPNAQNIILKADGTVDAAAMLAARRKTALKRRTLTCAPCGAGKRNLTSVDAQLLKMKNKYALEDEIRKNRVEFYMKSKEDYYKRKHYLKEVKTTEDDIIKKIQNKYRKKVYCSKGIQYKACGRDRLFTAILNLMKTVKTKDPFRKNVCLVEQGNNSTKFILKHELIDTTNKPTERSKFRPMYYRALTIVDKLRAGVYCEPTLPPLRNRALESQCQAMRDLTCTARPCCTMLMENPVFKSSLLSSTFDSKYSHR